MRINNKLIEAEQIELVRRMNDGAELLQVYSPPPVDESRWLLDGAELPGGVLYRDTIRHELIRQVPHHVRYELKYVLRNNKYVRGILALEVA